MRLREITSIALRLIAVYLLGQTLFYFPQVAQLVIFSDGFGPRNWGFIAAILVMVIAAVLLWVQAPRLARLATRDTETGTSVSPISMEGIELLAFSVLGIFLLVGSLPQLASDVAQLISPSTFDQFLPPQGPSDDYRLAKLLELAGTIGRALIGIWLLLGTNSFVAWLKRVRERARSGPVIAYEEENGD